MSQRIGMTLDEGLAVASLCPVIHSESCHRAAAQPRD